MGLKDASAECEVGLAFRRWAKRLKNEELSDAILTGAADTWAGKCEACGAEYSELPASDEGVCAKCGCHSVVERREPPLPNPE